MVKVDELQRYFQTGKFFPSLECSSLTAYTPAFRFSWTVIVKAVSSSGNVAVYFDNVESAGLIVRQSP
jgi:hypothetical protein